MDAIPVSPYQDFWFSLVGQFGGDAALALKNARHEVVGVIRKRYPSCYFDYEEIMYRALPLAIKDFNPYLGLATTHLCNKAIGVASNIIQTLSHFPKWEMPFADVDVEDKERIEEKNAVVDEPHTPGIECWWLKERLQSKHFSGVSCDKTYWDLAKLLRDGLSHKEIGKLWGISQPTLRLRIGELQRFLLTIPGIDEFLTD